MNTTSKKINRKNVTGLIKEKDMKKIQKSEEFVPNIPVVSDMHTRNGTFALKHGEFGRCCKPVP